MAGDPIEDERLTVVGLLFETHDGLVRRLQPQLSENGLAQGEFEAVLRLARTPGGRLRMTDLASQLRLSTSGLTRMVDRLTSQGLVLREACPSDRRGSFAAITPAGAQLVGQTLEGHLDLIDEWFTGRLEPSELDALTRALRKVRDVVHPDAAAGAPSSDLGSSPPPSSG